MEYLESPVERRQMEAERTALDQNSGGAGENRSRKVGMIDRIGMMIA
jgi:hypothetical protein